MISEGFGHTPSGGEFFDPTCFSTTLYRSQYFKYKFREVLEVVMCLRTLEAVRDLIPLFLAGLGFAEGDVVGLRTMRMRVGRERWMFVPGLLDMDDHSAHVFTLDGTPLSIVPLRQVVCQQDAEATYTLVSGWDKWQAVGWEQGPEEDYEVGLPAVSRKDEYGTEPRIEDAWPNKDDIRFLNFGTAIWKD